jgi:hypothetical protein
MPSKPRKKKDGQDPGKKRRRMRTVVARRKAQAGERSRQSDQPDVVKYKPGSASDRNQAVRTTDSAR